MSGHTPGQAAHPLDLYAMAAFGAFYSFANAQAVLDAWTRATGRERERWRACVDAALTVAAAPDPFPDGCTCLELEDGLRSPDPDCPAHGAAEAAIDEILRSPEHERIIREVLDRRKLAAAQEQPAPGTVAAADLMAAHKEGRTAWATVDQLRAALAALRSGITGLAADLDRSAAETRYALESETQRETAAALRRLLEAFADDPLADVPPGELLHLLRILDLTEIGKVCYDGYRSSSNGVSLVSGALLPEWDSQSGDIKRAWQAGAEWVVGLLADNITALAAEAAAHPQTTRESPGGPSARAS